MRCIPWIVGVALTLSAATTVQAGGYVLVVGDTRTELDLNQPGEMALPDGTKVRVLLQQKAEQTYREGKLSFAYPASIQPSATDVEKNVRQIMLVSARGNGVIIQHYVGLDPTNLIDLMVNEMTDEEVAAGYTRKITPARRTLSDGRQLAGKLAHTETSDEAWDRTILASGDRKGGYLVISMMEKGHREADKDLVERFWETLSLGAVD